MTVHLSNKSQPTTPTTKQMKRSQSNKFDNLVRYSSTSSSSFEVDDRTSVRSEIYYDNNQMPRIETVRSIDKDIYLEESIEKKKPKYVVIGNSFMPLLTLRQKLFQIGVHHKGIGRN